MAHDLNKVHVAGLWASQFIYEPTGKVVFNVSIGKETFLAFVEEHWNNNDQIVFQLQTTQRPTMDKRGNLKAYGTLDQHHHPVAPTFNEGGA